MQTVFVAVYFNFKVCLLVEVCAGKLFEIKVRYVMFNSYQQADNKKWLKYKIRLTPFQVFDANF